MNIRSSGNAARSDVVFSHVTSDGSAWSISESFYSIEYSRIDELAHSAYRASAVSSKLGDRKSGKEK